MNVCLRGAHAPSHRFYIASKWVYSTHGCSLERWNVNNVAHLGEELNYLLSTKGWGGGVGGDGFKQLHHIHDALVLYFLLCCDEFFSGAFSGSTSPAVQDVRSLTSQEWYLSTSYIEWSAKFPLSFVCPCGEHPIEPAVQMKNNVILLGVLRRMLDSSNLDYWLQRNWNGEKTDRTSADFNVNTTRGGCFK